MHLIVWNPWLQASVHHFVQNYMVFAGFLWFQSPLPTIILDTALWKSVCLLKIQPASSIHARIFFLLWKFFSFNSFFTKICEVKIIFVTGLVFSWWSAFVQPSSTFFGYSLCWNRLVRRTKCSNAPIFVIFTSFFYLKLWLQPQFQPKGSKNWVSLSEFNEEHGAMLGL